MTRFKLSRREVILSLSIVGLVVLVIMFFLTQEDEPTSEPFEGELFQEEIVTEEAEQAEASNGQIFVDVKGAVHKPGVYEMVQGSRVIDAIDQAGGFQGTALEKEVNLAAHVVDEMLIYVPEQGEASISDSTSQPSSGQAKININTATSEELQQLNGVGPAKAEAIIAYREEVGRFKKVEDLLEVSGIGERSLEKLQDEIVVQ